jgi:hypothetical protein
MVLYKFHLLSFCFLGTLVKDGTFSLGGRKGRGNTNLDRNTLFFAHSSFLSVLFRYSDSQSAD